MLNNTGINLFVILSIFLSIQSVLNQELKEIETEGDKLLPPPVPQWCVGCMCKVLSSCREDSLKCEGDVCGPFKMTEPYWIDVGSPPTQEGVETSFTDCANDVFCSAKAVQRYMKKYNDDCNGDGEIDCHDFLLIHLHGFWNCKKRTLTTAQEKQFNDCKLNVASSEFDVNAKPK